MRDPQPTESVLAVPGSGEATRARSFPVWLRTLFEAMTIALSMFGLLERIAAAVPRRAPGHWHGNGRALVTEELTAFIPERGLAPR